MMLRKCVYFLTKLIHISVHYIHNSYFVMKITSLSSRCMKNIEFRYKNASFEKSGCMDVGDRYRRPNVFATTLR